MNCEGERTIIIEHLEIRTNVVLNSNYEINNCNIKRLGGVSKAMNDVRGFCMNYLSDIIYSIYDRRPRFTLRLPRISTRKIRRRGSTAK